jgi:putative transcriptional regulator
LSASLKGQILIAQPTLADPNFRCTVVLITEHDDSGAFGLVLNRVGSHSVAELWRTLTEANSSCSESTFVGGPVQPSSVFLLHTHEDLAEDEPAVVPGLFMGSSVDLLRSLIERREVETLEASFDPVEAGLRIDREFRVYFGYAGWGAGQLDREIFEGGWLLQPVSTDIVFDQKPEILWQRVLSREERGLYRFFSLMPRDPEQN